MDTNKIANIIFLNVNVEPINEAIKNRAAVLAEQLNPEAAEQFVSDMSELECSVQQEGMKCSFVVHPSKSYLLNYLKSHDVPVAGGDNGTVHNVDGSTYESSVPEALWGTPLPWLELPILQGEEEVDHIVSIMAQDAMEQAFRNSKEEIAETVVKPYVANEFSKVFGGG